MDETDEALAELDAANQRRLTREKLDELAKSVIDEMTGWKDKTRRFYNTSFDNGVRALAEAILEWQEGK